MWPVGDRVRRVRITGEWEPEHGRSGMAVAAVLLVTLALLVMAHGALLLARTESLVARFEAGRVAADYRAATALAEVEYRLDSLPGEGSYPTPYGSVSSRRLSPEVALLVAAGDVRGAEGRGRLLFAPDARARLLGRSGGIIVAGAVIRSAEARVGVASAGACSWGSPTIPVFVRSTPGEPHPALGPVPVEDLLARLPESAPGSVVPDSAFALGVAGDANVTGSGAGVLAVTGDLVLSAGAELRGWLWVGGDFTLLAGARFDGFADVGGVLRLEGDGTYYMDACSAARALSAAADLRRPWGVGPLGWPAF